MPRVKTSERIAGILEAGGTIHFSALVDELAVSPSTLKKHLNAVLRAQPLRLGQVTGFIPQSDILVAAAEASLGPITSFNLVEANLLTKKMIEGITAPEMELFLRESLAAHLNGGSDEIKMPFGRLIEFVSTELAAFTAESGNGAVSIVGRLNEEIFLRALQNSNAMQGQFQRSGTDSNGDIIVSQRGGQQDNLYVEVKSYHARERLLRGLQDINRPAKVGVGFFQKANEFNARRTQTLLGTHPWAIYLPRPTYDAVEQSAKDQVTSKQDRLYRPLEMFVEDMVHFVDTGSLLRFRP